MSKVKVIYEDQEILVCFKEVGIPTQTATLATQDMVSLVKAYLVAQKAERNPYLGLVHRLDQPVSGLLVFAKNKKAASLEIKEKQYYALCQGTLVKKEGTLKHYLWKNPKNNMAEIKEKEDEAAKLSILSYEVVKQEKDCALVKIKLETGRFHQIRAQFAGIGHPLLGDLKYGNESSKALSAKEEIKTIALCAYHLKLIHPRTKKQMEFHLPRELSPLWL